ncbi:catechol oxidase [Ranunculus cassubicifolius]
MACKPTTKITFSPLGKHHLERPCVHGFRVKGLNRTFCGLKQNNDYGSLSANARRIALKGLVSLASSMLNKGITENASENQDIVAEELEEIEASKLEEVTEFASSSQSLDSVIRVLAMRPKVQKELEVLIIEGVEYFASEETVGFDVYINKAFGNMAGPDYGEFVGSEADCRNGSLQVDITNSIMAIGAESSGNIVVTLVPRTGKAIIGGVRIVSKGVVGNIQMNNLFTYRKDEKKKMIMVNLKHEFQISEHLTKDVSLILWLMPYLIILMPYVKDVLGELTKMVQ